MVDTSNPTQPSQDMESAVLGLTTVLLAVASGDFGVRAPRDYSGDAIDVLAFLVNSTAEEVGFLVAQLEDERRQLQAARDQLVHAAKMTALGELAAGVAHELNQPLTVIGILLELLLARPDKPIGDCQEDLALLTHAARRMGRIVDNVRLFGRGGPLQRARISPAQPVAATLEAVSGLMHRTAITVETDFAQSLPDLNADADRLQQVFANLLSNARDALCDLETGKPRCIRVVIRGAESKVIYRVEDTGAGVPGANVPRIFDPFFTTKEVGQGTGLGLSLSHGIIVAHGGSLRYEHTTGGGACFIVELPTGDFETGPSLER